MHTHNIRWDMGVPLRGNIPTYILRCLLLLLLRHPMGRQAWKTFTMGSLLPSRRRPLLCYTGSLNGRGMAPIVAAVP